MKNIYSYLEEINFEKRIKERYLLIQKTGIDKDIISEFALQQFCFRLLQDMYEKIYNDLEIKNNSN